MGQIHCQVRIPHRSLITADDVINTFNFTGVDDTEDQATVALGKLKAFYNDLSGTQTVRIKDMFSGEMNLANTRIKVYDASDPEPRVPILDASLGVSAATPLAGANLPGEVAICCSYFAAQQSGVAAARRRGRIYLGPLSSGVQTSSGAVASRPSTATMGNIAQAAKELANGPVGTQWCVWSRKNSAYYIIRGGFVDDSFDTQRRRGVNTTARVGWTGGLG